MANCSTWKALVRKTSDVNHYYLHVWGAHDKKGATTTLSSSNGKDFTLAHTGGSAAGTEAFSVVKDLGALSGAPTDITVNGSSPILSEPTGDHIARCQV
jgi:hypothetical protein